MIRRVPVAKRNLFHDRRRAALSVAGIAASFLLVLILDGVFSGAMQQVTSYIRHSPADVFVAQQGVTTMHMTSSTLDPTIVPKVASIDGVAWVEGLRFTTSTLDASSDSMLTYVFGYSTDTSYGGPRRIVAGAPPRRSGIVVDEAAADELGIRIGDTVTVLGAAFRVDGLSTGGTYITNTTVFIRADDFAMLRGDAFAYLLVGARPGTDVAALRDEIADAVPSSTVMTRSRFAREEANVVRSMAADVMLIMSTIGFVISLGVIGLTLFAATVAKQREYGVMKAIGARHGRLVGIVVGQALIVVAAGLLLAVTGAVVLGRIITTAQPNVVVLVSAPSVVRTAVAGAIAASVAVVLPLRRVIRIDAATAFRRI